MQKQYDQTEKVQTTNKKPDRHSQFVYTLGDQSKQVNLTNTQTQAFHFKSSHQKRTTTIIHVRT